jgi:hypothetical protein
VKDRCFERESFVHRCSMSRPTDPE